VTRLGGIGLAIVAGSVAASTVVAGESPRPRAGATFFLAFDGAVLTAGPDDATTNTSEIAEQYDLAGAYPPWGGSEAQRAAIAAAVAADFQAFDVEIVTARPEAGPYAMVLLGPREHALGDGIKSLGTIDCLDQNRSNVAMVFWAAADLGGLGSAATQATEVSQELAHAAGLEHVTGADASADVLYPSLAGVSTSFLDACLPLGPGIQCGEQHAMLSPCGDDQQNSFRELLALFGPAIVDAEPPTVAIVAPADGAGFPSGATVAVEIDADDDTALESVALEIDGESSDAEPDGAWTWTIEGLPDGEHELVAVALDAAGNEARSEAVSVLLAEPGEGCGCQAAGSAGGVGGLLALLGFRRRRRPSRPPSS
jgi:hypothetical protein